MRLMKEEAKLQNLSDFENKSLLIVDDDNPFRERLARAMEKKGFEVFQAESVQKGVESVKTKKPGFAVVDLRLADGNGLEVVKEIQSSNSDSRIIMLTGYGNIPTAVAAIKEGAIDYLAKPADAEDVEKALLIEFSSYVIGMFQKQPEDLKCTEELFKEFFPKDHLDKFFNFNYLLSQKS